MADILDAGRNPDETFDGTKVLSAMSGERLSPADVQGAFQAAKANIAAWKNCPAPHHVARRFR